MSVIAESLRRTTPENLDALLRGANAVEVIPIVSRWDGCENRSLSAYNMPMTADSEATDALDREILGILREDARIPWQMLGERVGLSANAAADRVRRLVRRRVISRFTVMVDQRTLGRSLSAIIDARIATTPKFDEALRKRDDVVWAAHVTGVPDVKILVACEGTDGLDRFLQWLHKQGATDTRTDVVLRHIV
jgi:Lrp/AsnC family leucine-responsive transcriptional regulator